MTGSTPPTVDEGMREAVATLLCNDVEGDAVIQDLTDEIMRVFASALAARERERDEARAELDALIAKLAATKDELSDARYRASEAHEAECDALGRTEDLEAELATFRASAERMEAAATLALAELDWQVTASAHCGDPNHECPMQDIHAPSDGHSIARSALRAALTPKEPDHG